MDTGPRTQNLLMYFGAMAALATFWLALLGLQSGSWRQLAGAALALLITVLCFRTYVSAMRAEREKRPDGP